MVCTSSRRDLGVETLDAFLSIHSLGLFDLILECVYNGKVGVVCRICCVILG